MRGCHLGFPQVFISGSPTDKSGDFFWREVKMGDFYFQINQGDRIIDLDNRPLVYFDLSYRLNSQKSFDIQDNCYWMFHLTSKVNSC